MNLSKNHSREIANGQTPGNRLGNFTCSNNQGVSVVRYLPIDRLPHKNITYFKVLPPEFDSKDASITATLKSS